LLLDIQFFVIQRTVLKKSKGPVMGPFFMTPHKYNMQYRYMTNKLKTDRRWNPDNVRYGHEPVNRDKYYSYLKHRSQARHRGEDYHLTSDEWMKIWEDDEQWFRRGRHSESICLGRLDWDQGWQLDNVELMTRQQHFENKKAWNRRDRS
jgi:hypothetical protein